MATEATRVLVGCVGHNPGSCLIAARKFQVSRAVLVCTAATRPQLQVVAAQLRVPVREVMLVAGDLSVAGVEAKVRGALDLGPEERVILDATGGTKLMGIGAWLGLSALPRARWSAVYLENDGELLDPRSGQHLTYRVAIEIDEILAWHGRKIRGAAWRGMLSDVQPEIRRRASLGDVLMKAVAEKRVRFYGNNTALFLSGTPPRSLPAGFRREENRVKTTVSRYFSKNQWLEELCVHRARVVFSRQKNIRAAAGVKTVLLNDRSEDEADVVLVRGPRTCIIEAKARLQYEGAGAELQKRIAKTWENFGAHAKVIFVHPAWGQQPPRDLVAMVGARATLVGANPVALDRAIFDALCFRRDGTFEEFRKQTR